MTEEKSIREEIAKEAGKIVDLAEKMTKQRFEGIDLEQQENLDLFNEFFKEYSKIISDDYLERFREQALAPFTEEEEEAINLNFEGYPDKALFHTALLSRDLPLLMQEDKEQPNLFNIKRRERSKDFIGTITIDEIIENNNISPLDMVHYLGVCRLFDNGTRTFTPGMLVRSTYIDNKKTVTENQRNEAIESVNKLMRTVIDIDVSEDYRAYHMIGKDEELFLGENMLHARRARLRHSNGSISWGYEILRQPVLDVHAFNLKQIDRLDNELVETSGGKEDLLLTNYLSIRLAGLMNNKNKISNTILLETVYKHMDIKEPNRQKRAQIRNKIEGRLTEWEDKEIIKSYEFLKEGNKITKFKIVM